MSFKDILGQDKPIGILRQQFKENRLFTSYIFSGPEGIGKKLTAVALSKALNCEKEDFNPCDACPTCLRIEKNQHPDFFLIDAGGLGDADNIAIPDSRAIKISSVRQLQKSIALKPYEARYKVFIIDNAHNLTSEASNALLKILEEPPPHSLIMLVSSKPNLLFRTIISRCCVIKFYPLTRDELEGILRNTYLLHVNLAHFLAYFCDGRLGQAIRLKDTDILREKNAVIDDFATTASFKPGSLQENRDGVRMLIHILLSWFRDIYLAKCGLAPLQLIHCDRKPELLKLVPQIAFQDLERVFNRLYESLGLVDDNVNIKLLQASLREELWRG